MARARAIGRLAWNVQDGLMFTPIACFRVIGRWAYRLRGEGGKDVHTRRLRISGRALRMWMEAVAGGLLT